MPHKLRGTWRADRHDRGPEPIAPGLLIEPPAYLNEAQAKRFRQILAEAPRHLLRRWDCASLAAFTVAESLLIEATEARKREEENALLDRSEHGQIIIDALVKLQLRALAAMKPYIDMLGFSPSSRTNLKLDASGETDNPDDWRWRKLAALSRGETREPTAAEHRRRKRQIASISRTLERVKAREATERAATLAEAGNVVELPVKPADGQ
jgi:phage terminase small subunit